MTTEQHNVIVGGKHNGKRIETLGAMSQLRLPVYDDGPFVSFEGTRRAVEVCEYERTKFVAGGIAFSFWVPTGQTGAETMRKLLDGYRGTP
jgi:hypothetical protein